MQDHPTAPELLDAVAEYLFGELRPQVPGDQRFKVLVAANLCAVVARELRAGEASGRADAELFATLLDEGEAGADSDEERLAKALAAKIRGGEYDGRLEELVEALRGHVARKLDIARPGYRDSSL